MAAFGVVVFTWPLVLQPTDLYGHVQGEASNHLWMFWRAGVSGPVANYPVGLPIPLMDPVNLPVYRSLAWVHPALGYNAVWCFNLGAAFWGALFLSRALGVSRMASVSAGVACAFSPFLSGLGSFGITESWGVGWLGFHLAFVLRYSESGRKRDLCGAAVFLGAFLYTGWYSAVFAVIAEIGVAVFLWRRGRLGAGFLVQGFAAAVLVLPRLVSFWKERQFWADRWVGVPTPLEGQWEPWRELPRSGADALNLVLPSVGAVPVSKSVYLGLIVLGLAIYAGKKARVLWVWAVPFLVLSLGTHLMIGGHQNFGGVSVSLPADWIRSLVPPLEGLTHWYRALGPAILFLAVAAAMGVERLSSRYPKAVVVLPVLIFLEGLILSQTPWPRALVSIEPPSVYESLSRDGALLQLPLHNNRREFTSDEPRVYNRWQPMHGLSVVENYEGSDALLDRNPWVEELQGLCVQGRPMLLSLAEQQMWSKELRKQGVQQVVVHGVAGRELPDAWQCGEPHEGSATRQKQADRVVDALEAVGAQVILHSGGDTALGWTSP